MYQAIFPLEILIAQCEKFFIYEYQKIISKLTLRKNSSLLSFICLQTLMKHFKTIPIVEKEAVSFFFYTVKTNANKLDQKNGLSSDAT